MTMRKTVIMISILVVIVIVIFLLLRTKCTVTSADPVIPEEKVESSDNSFGVVIEDDFPPDTSPGMIDPFDFASELLKTNPEINETVLRVEMYKAGYSASEIKATINSVMSRDESTVSKGSSDPSDPVQNSEETSVPDTSLESSELTESEDTEVIDNKEAEESKTNELNNSQESSKPDTFQQESLESGQEVSQIESSVLTEQENNTPETQNEESAESQEQAKEPDSQSTGESQTVSEDSEHIHDWIPIIEVIHHDAVYETVPVYEEQQILDAEAWDEEVMTGEYIYSCLGCAFETDNIEELADHCITEDHNYWCRPLTETIHHDAEYHTEKVKVGEEKVLVTEAWDEEIITGYQCSECGGVK